MPPLPALVADFLAIPCPVLCLDTCDLLDVVQCLQDFSVDRVRPAARLREALRADPNRVRLVTTYLVRHEWNQNLPKARADAEASLTKLDEQAQRVHQAWDNLDSPLGASPPAYGQGPLVDRLQGLALLLLNQATEVDQDAACVSRALVRVMNKVRPSHNGMVKDSIHLEHYLELVRHLRAGGFAERCAFGSRNQKDYWKDKSNDALHADLEPDFLPLQLEFFGNLGAACGSLRI